MLHEILRLEVRARRVFAPSGVDDGEVAFFPCGFERSEVCVEAEFSVERDGILFLQREAGPGFVVMVVLGGHDEREAVCAAAEKDNDEGAFVVGIG